MNRPQWDTTSQWKPPIKKDKMKKMDTIKCCQGFGAIGAPNFAGKNVKW